MNHARHITFRDLISPRAVYSYTLEDAIDATPRMLIMISVLFGSVLVLYGIKKLIEMCIFHKYMRKKYMLKKCEVCPDGVDKKWVVAPIQHWSSVTHLILETLFIVMLLFVLMWACSLGGFDIWVSGTFVGLLTIVAGYALGPGLQQCGSGYFNNMFNLVSYGEYWRVCGTDSEGRVSRITPAFIELEGEHPISKTARTIRIPMADLLSRIMERDYAKEANAPEVSIFEDELGDYKIRKQVIGPAKILRREKEI